MVRDATIIDAVYWLVSDGMPMKGDTLRIALAHTFS